MTRKTKLSKRFCPTVVPPRLVNVPSPRKNVVVLLGGVGTAPPTVALITGKSAPVAMDNTPVVVVFLTIPVASPPRNWAPVIPLSVVPCAINLLVSAILADPLNDVPAIVLAVVKVAADPVVF